MIAAAKVMNLDIKLDQMGGVEVLKGICCHHPDLPCNF